MIKQLLMGVVLGLLLMLAGGLAVVLGGLPNVAAGWRDPPILAWLLHTTYERSVVRRATALAVPAKLDDAAQVLAGARAFDEMCAICHTPPGAQPTIQSAGLNPRPPALSDLAAQRTPAEAFWVIDNGVRLTAMPAFGPTHTEAQLWQLVAFLQHARDLDVAGYADLMERARQLPASDGHQHRHGGASGEAMRNPGEHHAEEDGGGPAKPADQTVPADGHSHATGDHHEH